MLWIRLTTVKSWFKERKDAAAGYLDRHNRVRRALPVLLEIALVAAIAAFAVRQFWKPPSDAANMPQESAKYAIGAWNLYKNGRYELFVNHKPYPAPGGLGYAYVILPSFLLFGDFLGNAIYTQLALATSVCVGVYIAVRRCFGLWAGACAAVVSALYPTFVEYAQMNDTSIASGFFLVAGALIFLWILEDSCSPLVKWALWGLTAGWATAVRVSNAPVFAALTIALLWLLQTRPRQVGRHLFAAAIGAVPLVIPVLLFNHHYCGSCWRDAHAFWQSNPFDNLSRVFSLRYAFGFPENKTEVLYHGMLIYYLREIACQFSNWPRAFLSYGAVMRPLVFLLSGVMVVGVMCGFRRARDSDRARQFVCFTMVTIGITLLFYCFHMAGNRRYIVPLAPLCASFVGVGSVDIIRWLWRRRLKVILIPVFVLALVVPMYCWAHGKDNNLILLGEEAAEASFYQKVAAYIESNAVIIADTHWELIEHFLIRDTARTYMPLRNRLRFRVQPRPPKDASKIPFDVNAPYEAALENGAVDLFDFTALEAPERIQRMLAGQRHVYLIDWSDGPVPTLSEDCRLLAQYFDLEIKATLTTRALTESTNPPLPVECGIVLCELKSRIPLVN